MKTGKVSRPCTCASCKQPINAGDRVRFTQAMHLHCSQGSFNAVPPAPTLEFTRLKALDALEEAIQAAAHVHGVSDELEKEWERYEKLKGLGLRAGSSNEERLALRNALLGLVKMSF